MLEIIGMQVETPCFNEEDTSCNYVCNYRRVSLNIGAYRVARKKIFLISPSFVGQGEAACLTLVRHKDSIWLGEYLFRYHWNACSDRWISGSSKAGTVYQSFGDGDFNDSRSGFRVRFYQ